MDLHTAYEILDLPISASLEEVKERYHKLAKQRHPDVSRTRDSRQFVLLTTAYSLILDESQGKKRKPTTEEGTAEETELAPTFVIQEHIQDRFEHLKRDFQSFLDQKVERTKGHIANLIDSAGSGNSLKDLVQTSVAKVWIDMVKEIENYLLRLCKKATTEDRDFLFALFNDLYAEQRRFWLANLYRNPTILLCVALFLLLCAAPAYPQLKPLVMTFRLESAPWLTFFPLVAGLCFIAVRLRQLNPRHQFLPPRLSPFEVQAQTQAIAARVGQDKGEATASGVVAGAILGSFIPGLGTLIGAGIGGLWGMLSGKSLADMKEQVWMQLDTEMRLGLEQLNDRLRAWIEQQKEQYTNAATESFARNIKKVAQFLQSHTHVARQIAVESRLLLPAPEERATPTGTTQPVERSEISIRTKASPHPIRTYALSVNMR